MVVYLLCTGELFEAMAYCARHPTTLAMLVLSALLGTRECQLYWSECLCPC